MYVHTAASMETSCLKVEKNVVKFFKLYYSSMYQSTEQLVAGGRSVWLSLKPG